MLWRHDTIQLSVVQPSVAVLNVVAPIGSQVNNFQVFFIYNLQVPEASFSSNSFFAGGSLQFWEMVGTPLAFILHFLVKISSLWGLYVKL
jgi:hypothetical protein